MAVEILTGSIADSPLYALDFKLWHGYDLAGDVAAGRIKLALYQSESGSFQKYLADCDLLDDPIVAFSSPAWWYYETPPAGNEIQPHTAYRLTSGPVTFPSPTPVDLRSVLDGGPGTSDGSTFVQMFRDTGDPATSALWPDKWEWGPDVIDGSPFTVSYNANGGYGHVEPSQALEVSIGSSYDGNSWRNRSSHNRNAGLMASGGIDWRVGPFKMVLCNEIYGPHRRRGQPSEFDPGLVYYYYADDHGLDAATWSPRNHRWLSDIPDAAILGISDTMQTRTLVDIRTDIDGNVFFDGPGAGVGFEAHDLDIEITTSGTIWNVLLFLDTGNPATSPLLCAVPPGWVDIRIVGFGGGTQPFYNEVATVTAGNLAFARFGYSEGESPWGGGGRERGFLRSVSPYAVDY